MPSTQSIFLFASVGTALASGSSLRSRVESSLRLGGSQNCAYKCGLQWNQRSGWNTAGTFRLYEYTACIQGCNFCGGGENRKCQTQCKKENWPTYAYTLNAAKKLKRFDNDAFRAPLTQCLDKCLVDHDPTPATGAGKDGKLPKPYTQCTIGCYDTHFGDVLNKTISACHAGATAASCGPTDVDCYTKDDCFFGLAKGVVEPDKACIQGCSQNLCQAGADCNGKGYWDSQESSNERGCQLITSQTTGIRETVNPGYYGQQSDLGSCCNAALQRCGYAPGVGSSSFGVSLGKVIATDRNGCEDPDAPGGVWPVLQASYPYECDCDYFFDKCEGAMEPGTFPGNSFICYGLGGPRNATSKIA